MARIPYLLIAAALAPALLPSPARATVPPGPGDDLPDPPPPATLPDLRVSARAAVATDAGWKVTYTVRNDGTVASGPFKVAVARSGGDESVTLTEPGLAPGASHTTTAGVSRSTCYAAFRVSADPAQAVAEIADANNEAWTVGQAGSSCADAPRYTVRALDVKALRTQEAADEAYVVFSTAGVGTAQTRVSPVIEGMFPGRRVPLTNLCTCFEAPAPAGAGISAQVLENDHLYPFINDADPFGARNVLLDAFRSAGPLSDPLSASGWVAGAAPIMVDALEFLESRVDDDAIGSATVGHSAVDLARRLDVPGQFFDQTLALSGGRHAGDAFYQLRFRVMRVA